MKVCRFCDKKVPDECNGQIEDHCTWCGMPMDSDSSLPPDKDRFCTLDCEAENSEWDKKISNG